MSLPPTLPTNKWAILLPNTTYLFCKLSVPCLRLVLFVLDKNTSNLRWKCRRKKFVFLMEKCISDGNCDGKCVVGNRLVEKKIDGIWLKATETRTEKVPRTPCICQTACICQTRKAGISIGKPCHSGNFFLKIGLTKNRFPTIRRKFPSENPSENKKLFFKSLAKSGTVSDAISDGFFRRKSRRKLLPFWADNVSQSDGLSDGHIPSNFPSLSVGFRRIFFPTS